MRKRWRRNKKSDIDIQKITQEMENFDKKLGYADPDGNPSSSETETKPAEKHRILRRVLMVIAIIICVFGIFIALTSRWAFATWPNLGIEEMLFQLSNNVSGTGGGIIQTFVLQCVVPTLIILVAVIVMTILIRKYPKALRNAMTVELSAGLVLSLISVHTFYVKADVKGYLEAQNSSSSFIEDNYVDPTSVDITFPETKRNLIYIFLESMEMTYSDQEDGGAFDEDVIPELTELAEENECFAGSSGTLNGAYAYTNAHYTSAAMFAQTSGLPLQLNEDIYTLNNQDVFYPGISTIGSILANEGYSNTLLIGSDGNFGNRAAYFKSHGNYEIRDYQYAVDHGWIPSDYAVWWGYEDEKLFANAKTTLDELSSSNQPFNLTMLTVDTHFEDGYVCDLCEDEFDDQYANVMACSSRQVAAFIDWCRTQSWYENTTIVINGDHLTMDSDFCNDVDASYDRRTYTCYINAAAEPENPDWIRTYCTQDNFPTTLAAMGCQIEGNRLGLGTNLFSSTETLSEQYGTDTVNQEMRNKSEWLTDQSDVSSSISADVSLIRRDDGGLSVYVTNMPSFQQGVTKVTAVSKTDSGSTARTMTGISDGYAVKLSPEECNYGNSFYLKIYITLGDGSTKTLYERQYSPDLVACTDLAGYIQALDNLNCDVLTSLKIGSAGMSEEALTVMQSLGFTKVPDDTQTVYAAVLTNDGVEEYTADRSEGKLKETGELSSGVSYELISSGTENAEMASITVDDLNSSMNGTGLNIVAVDRDTGTVLDAACWNPEDGTLTHK